MNLETIQKKDTFLVYGLGVEGHSTFSFLKKKFPENTIDVFDAKLSKETHSCFQSQEIHLYDFIFVSPGVSRDQFSETIQHKITSQIEVFFAHISESNRKKVIGITGTKGKSTTTKFCIELLQENGNTVVPAGNYGVPVLDILDDFEAGKYEYVVCELSSYQLEYLRLSPGIALFLNIYPEHLERHHGYKGYKESKRNLWRYQKKGDLVFALKDSLSFVQEGHKNTVIPAQEVSADYFPENSVFRAHHFRENFGVVFALSEALGIPESVFFKTAQNFKGLPHRLESIDTKQGIEFVNDSISTNCYSAVRALEYFGERTGVLILGGQNKDAEYELVYEAIQKYCPKTWVCVLQSDVSDEIQNVFQSHQFTQFSVVNSMKEAVTESLKKAPSGTVCLLSPAAKSFDGFKDYKDRGDQFRAAVEAL